LAATIGAREGDRNTGVQFDPVRRDAGDGEREARVVPILLRADAGVAVGFDRLGGRSDFAEVFLREGREDTHAPTNLEVSIDPFRSLRDRPRLSRCQYVLTILSWRRYTWVCL